MEDEERRLTLFKKMDHVEQAVQSFLFFISFLFHFHAGEEQINRNIRSFSDRYQEHQSFDKEIELHWPSEKERRLDHWDPSLYAELQSQHIIDAHSDSHIHASKCPSIICIM